VISRPRAILALLTGLNLLNYLDRLVVSAVLPKIEVSLGLSKLVEGTLATVFLVGYFLTSPIFGTLADRGKRKGLVAIGVAVWSAATIASGLATGMWSLLAARAVVGVGEASYATIAPTIIDDIAPPEKKGRWLAVFFAMTPVGGALGYFTGGIVEHAYGWRAAFFVAGGPGMILAVLCLLIAEPERRVVKARESALQAARALVPFALYRRGVLGYCAYTFVVGGFSYWAPTFLYEHHHMELGRANFLFGAVTVAGGAIGTAIGGSLGDRAARVDRGEASSDLNAARGYLVVCAAGAAIAAPLALAAFLAPTSTGFFAWAFFCEVALFLSTSPINAVILRAVPVERRASAMALAILGIHLLGDLWSPPLIGTIADLGRRAGAANAMQIAMFPLPAGLAVAALLWWARSTARAPAAA